MTGPATAWIRRLLLTVVYAMTALAVAARPAAADPTPTPPPTRAGPAPSPSAAEDDRAGRGCVNGQPPNRIGWCFGWVSYDSSPAVSGPTRWLTVCSRTTTTDEQDACDTASLTLTSPPPDGTVSVLHEGERPGDSTPLVHCEWFAAKAGADSAHAGQWTAKRERCTRLEKYLLARVSEPHQDTNAACLVAPAACEVGQAVKDALAGGVRTGIQGVVDVVVQAFAWGLGQLAEVVFDTTSLQDPDEAFYWTYNQVSGLLIILVFLFFLISTIVNGLRITGPGPLATLGGLVRAILGITFAAGIAFVITRAWDEAANALIERNSTGTWNPGAWIAAATALSGGAGTMFLVFVVAVFALIGLLLLFIVLLFRNLLLVGAALFGAMAMSGQVMAETRHWGRRWLWTVNALASSKFWIVALWIYGSRSVYETNNFMTVLKGLLMIWLMVLAPWVMLRLTTMWDGYLSDVHARGVLSAAGHGAGVGSMLDRAASLFGGAGEGSGDDAATVMNANTADIPTTVAGAIGQTGGSRRDLNRRAGDAVGTGGDGGRVGEADQGDVGLPPGDGSRSGGADEAGHPNADEAQATEQTHHAAGQDITGHVSAPDDQAGGAAPDSPPSGPEPSGPGGAGRAGPGNGGSPATSTAAGAVDVAGDTAAVAL